MYVGEGMLTGGEGGEKGAAYAQGRCVWLKWVCGQSRRITMWTTRLDGITYSIQVFFVGNEKRRVTQ